MQLVFLLAFCVAAIGTYFNMLPLPRLETKQKSCVDLAHFKISMTLTEIDDRWLSVDEICKYLGIGKDTVYKWIDQLRADIDAIVAEIEGGNE